MIKAEYIINSNTTVYLPEHSLREIRPLLEKLGARHYLEDNLLSIPQGIIGHIETDNVKIIINPSIKHFSSQDYLRLIKPNDNLTESENGFIGMSSGNSLSSYIINEFLNSLKTVIKAGLPRRYMIKDSKSHYATGSINYIESYKSSLLYEAPVFHTSIAELSSNHSELKIIKAAYNKICKNQSARVDYSIVSALSSIEETRSVTELLNNSSFFTKNESDLAYTHHLATMILKNMSATSRQSDYEMSLLVNANAIFENFLFSLLTSLFPRDKFEKQVECIITDGDKKLLSYADIVFYGSHSVVIDAKNKIFSASPSNSDYYQMFSYLESYKVNTAILVYPHFEDSNPKEVTPKENSSLKIYMVPLNIKPENCEFNKIHFDKFKDTMDNLLRFG